MSDTPSTNFSTTYPRAAAAVPLLLLLSLGCGGEDTATGTTAGTAGQGGIDSQFNPGGSGAGGNGGFGGVCAADTHAADRVPPSILLLLDGSASMGSGISGGGSRWTAAAAAVANLVTEGPPDVHIGLSIFPGADDLSKCLGSIYGTPLVNVEPVTTSGLPIQCHAGAETNGCGSITPHELIVGTPIQPALSGSTDYLTSLNAEGSRVILLLTDAMPVGCASNDIESVIAQAASAFGGDPQVTVYVLGVAIDPSSGGLAGVRCSNASRIANAGGGKRTPNCVADTTDPALGCAYNIRDSSFQADLEASLNDISGKVLSCTFALPTGENIDPTKVNVTLAANGSSELVPRDPAHEDGWDFSDSNTTVTLYGPPCDTVKSTPGAEVTIELGCETVMQVPR